MNHVALRASVVTASWSETDRDLQASEGKRACSSCAPVQDEQVASVEGSPASSSGHRPGSSRELRVRACAEYPPVGDLRH